MDFSTESCLGGSPSLDCESLLDEFVENLLRGNCDDTLLIDALELVDNPQEVVVAALEQPALEEVVEQPAQEEVVEQPAQEEGVEQPAQEEVVVQAEEGPRQILRKINVNRKIIAVLTANNTRLTEQLTDARVKKLTLRRKAFVPKKCRFCQKNRYSATKCAFKGVGISCGHCDRVGRSCHKAAVDNRHHG